MRLLLTNLLFWVILALTCLLVENINVFGVSSFIGLTSSSFILISTLLIFVLVCYFLLEHKENKMKVDFVLLTVFTLLFITSTIMIWKTPYSQDFVNANNGYTVNVTITNYEKIRYTIETGFIFIFLYILMFCVGRNRVSSLVLNWFSIAIVIFSFIGIIYSLVTEFSDYISFFKDGVSIDIHSFYSNKNTYGYSLLIGLLSCYVLSHKKSRIILNIIIYILFFFILLSRCSTVILISLITVPCFILFDIVRICKKKFALGLSYLIIFLLGVLTIFILFFVGGNQEKGFLNHFYELIKSTVNEKDYDSLTGRDYVWKYTFELIKNNDLTLFFGYGHGIANIVFKAKSLSYSGGSFYVVSSHNGFLDVMLNYGLVGLFFYCVLLLYFLYVMVRLTIKKQFKTVFIYFMCFMSIIAESITETNSFMKCNISGVIATILFLLPPIYIYKHMRHPSIKKDIYDTYVDPNMMNNHLLTRTISYILFSLLLVSCLFYIVPDIYLSNQNLLILTNVVISLFIANVFVPYLVTLWHTKTSQRKFALIIIIWVVLALSIILTLIYFGFFTNKINNIRVWLIPLVIYGFTFLVFVGYFIYKKGHFKYWIKDTFFGAIMTSFKGIVITVPIGLISLLLFDRFAIFNLIDYIVFPLLFLIIYYISGYVRPTNYYKDILNYYNNVCFIRLKKLILDPDTL